MFKMTFQVVELTIDANNNIIDRRVSPPRHTKHREAERLNELASSVRADDLGNCRRTFSPFHAMNAQGGVCFGSYAASRASVSAKCQKVDLAKASYPTRARRLTAPVNPTVGIDRLVATRRISGCRTHCDTCADRSARCSARDTRITHRRERSTDPSVGLGKQSTGLRECGVVTEQKASSAKAGH